MPGSQSGPLTSVPTLKGVKREKGDPADLSSPISRAEPPMAECPDLAVALGYREMLYLPAPADRFIVIS